MSKRLMTKLLLVTLLLAFPLLAFSREKGASRGHQNELLVLDAIKQIYTAQHQYLFNVPPPPDEIPGPWLGTLKQLQAAGLIDNVLGSGDKFGYYFNIQPLPRSAFAPPNLILHAWPKVYRKTGVRSFRMNIDCAINGADRGGFFAEATDPVVDTCSPMIAYAYGEQTMADLRTIASAQFTYQAAIGNGYFGTFNQLVEAGLIGENIRFNYHSLVVSTTKPTLTTPATFKVWSTPTVYRESGVLSLFIDDTGILRGSDRGGEPADQDDPPIGLGLARIQNES